MFKYQINADNIMVSAIIYYLAQTLRDTLPEGIYFMNTVSIFKKQTVLILVFTFIFGAFAEAKNNPSNDNKISQRTLTAISEKLSSELKARFADDSATVQINKIEKRQETKTSINLDGAAFCVLANNADNRLPLSFEAEINARTNDLIDISYKFIEDSPNFAPTTTEEFLMKELMKKIGKDHKTTSIVIAIDGFELISDTDGREFLGTGEIKIGEMGWSKIKFDVVLNDANEATKLIYNIE